MEALYIYEYGGFWRQLSCSGHCCFTGQLNNLVRNPKNRDLKRNTFLTIDGVMTTAMMTTNTDITGPVSTPHTSFVPGLPFIPECELLYEGGLDSKALFDRCQKHPNHDNFLSVADLSLEDLPLEWQSRDHLDYIRACADLTVKVDVQYTSPARPDKWPGSDQPYPYWDIKDSTRAVRCGSGCIKKIVRKFRGVPCPCPPCTKSGRPKMSYWLLMVKTAAHVIYDDSEAREAVFECFYDSMDRSNVKSFSGVCMSCSSDDEDEKCRNDSSMVNCITHDEDLVELLCRRKQKLLSGSRVRLGPQKAFIISHPHGMYKRLTVGNISHYTFFVPPKLCDIIPNGADGCPRLFPNNAKCRLRQKTPSIHINKTTTNHPSKSDIRSDETDLASNSNSHPTPHKSTKTTKEENKRVQLCHVKPDLEMKPGYEYILSGSITLTLPQNSQYLCQYRKYDEEDAWVSFPENTTFTLGDGRSICLPIETEFQWEGMYEALLRPLFESYFSYDMATCPGCSGAPVKRDDRRCINHSYSHSGVLHNGLNRSGLDVIYGINKKQINSTAMKLQ